MKKIRLDLDALEVDSFHTGGWVGRGTVRGRDTTGALDCPGGTLGCPNDTFDPCQGGGTYTCTCAGQWTCPAGACQHTHSPENTCYDSCGPSCPFETCGYLTEQLCCHP